MYAFEDNLEAVRTALAQNVVVLPVPAAEATEAHHQAAGQVLMDLLDDRGRLLPAYWDADGTESAPMVKALDGMASCTRKLYFSLLRPEALEERTTLIRGLPSAALARALKGNHIWLNALRMLSPSAEQLAELGAWLYGLPADDAPLTPVSAGRS